MSGSLWTLSHRAAPAARAMADRHYNRQSIGAAGFVPPGRCLVLTHGDPVAAFWVTSWPFAEYTKHRWAGAWVCSAFRRENGAAQASSLIVAAVAATRAAMGEPPSLGMITFIDRTKVAPIRERSRDVWGRTYRLVGFEEDGESRGGLLCLRLPPERMPTSVAAVGSQVGLFR